MLTRHAVTPIHGAKHIAWKFSRLCWFEMGFWWTFWSFLRGHHFLRCSRSSDWYSYHLLEFCLFLSLLDEEYGVEGSGTVISNEHRYTALVILRHYLGAASTLAMSIVLAY